MDNVDRIMSQERCTICPEIQCSGESVILTSRGVNGINAASKERGVDIVVHEGDSVHVKCRQKYVNKKQISLDVGKDNKEDR